MLSEKYERIRNHPRYQELVRRRGRMGWSLTLLTLGLFFGFMLVASLRPDLLATPLSSSGVTNLAVVLGVVMLVVFWIFTGLYARLTTRIYDKISDQILRDVQDERLHT